MHGGLARFPILRRVASRRVLLAASLLAATGPVLAGSHAFAALPVGTKAPVFSAAAALAGKRFTFSLADALKRGPVVVYFYPAAFTRGCTIEAHEFAAAMPEFSAAGASVIGVSEDKIETLERFSASACQGRFPVAADRDGMIARQFDSQMPGAPAYASRTSYVVAPDGTVIESYSARDPGGHVRKTLDAVKAFRSKQKS